MKKFISLFIFSLCINLASQAQVSFSNAVFDSQKIYDVKMVDGTVYSGYYITHDSTQLTIRTKLFPSIIIPFAKIESINEINNQGLLPNSSKFYAVTLINKSKFKGQYLYTDSNFMALKTEAFNKIEIPLNKIKSIKEISQEEYINARSNDLNINSEMYFVTPSAFALRKGEFSWHNTYLFFQSFDYGITDHITLGAGTETFFLFSEEGPRLAYLSTKVNYSISKNLRSSGGVLIGTTRGHYNSTGFAVLNTAVTFGNSDYHTTAGVIVGYYDNRLINVPLFSISGLARVSEHWAFVSNNLIVNDAINTTPFASLGMRYFSRHFSLDLAYFFELDEGIGIPFVGFDYKF
jgi:hypothetical protein